MNDQAKKNDDRKDEPRTTEEKKKPTELSDQDLEAVSGGRASVSDIHFTKVVDKASPVLF